MTLDQKISELVDIHGKEAVQEMVTEWCNASEVDVDHHGNIWIAKPQTGHWMSETDKQTFYSWVEMQ